MIINVNYPTCPFYPVPPVPIGGFDMTTCLAMKQSIIDAMTKLLNSGVAEYHVGSRGLKKFSFKELQDMLTFWTNMEVMAAWGSGIVARRAMPTDT
jgi:hypothetical protein